MRPVETIRGAARAELDPTRLVDAGRPVVFKALVADWPLVAQGKASPRAAIDYLARFDAGRPVVGYTGAPAIGGRFFYDETLRAMNFAAERVPLTGYLERIAAALESPDAPSFYVGSTDLDRYLPGLHDAHPLLADAAFGPSPPLASLWLGTRTVAATHFDMSHNLACVAVGRRRFTLFPPEQIANLYPGPLEPTPGGQVVSMVDARAPDLARYPRFAEAIAHAQVAELEPGDVLFYPALWWHQVEALDAFNAMINFWWNPSPAFLDTPMTTLLHALLGLRDRPDIEKRAWRDLFDYYVFGPAALPTAHLPASAHGALAPLDARGARHLRAQLIARLNR